MPMSSSGHSQLLFPGLRGRFGLDYKQIPKQYEGIFEVGSSTRATEDMLNISGFGLASAKAQGGAIAQDVSYQGWATRFVHEEYGIGFTITEVLQDDDLYGVVAKFPGLLARAVNSTVEILAANVFNNSVSASYLGGDGMPLLGNQSLATTGHPLIGGGTFDNRPSANVDLSVTSLEAAFTAVRNFTDDRGILISAKPTRLIIPNELEWAAEEILKTEKEVGTNNNTINNMRGKIPYSIMDNITDPDSWFLKTDIPDGLLLLWRKKPDLQKDNDVNTRNLLCNTRFRISLGWSDPRAIYGCPGG